MIETRQAKAVWRFYGPGSVIYHAAEAAGLKPEECVDLIEPLDEDSHTKDGVLTLPVHELRLVGDVLCGIGATEAGQWALRSGEVRLSVAIVAEHVDAYAELGHGPWHSTPTVQLDMMGLNDGLARRIEAARKALSGDS